MNAFQFEDDGRKDACYMGETGDFVARAIAIVRIAPVERWCRYMKQQLAGNPLYEKLPGLSIEIILDSMRTCSNQDDAEFRTWLMTKESAALLDSTILKLGDDDDHYVCEHLLQIGD